MTPKAYPLDRAGSHLFKTGTDYCLLLIDYLPTTRSVNVPGTMLGRGRGRSGVGAGGGPNSAVMRKTRCVFGSSVIVRAPLCVGTFSTTVNLPGESSWMSVSV